MRTLLAATLTFAGLSGAASAKECAPPSFFSSVPRDQDWYYGAGKGADAQKAREDALRNLGTQVSGEVQSWDAAQIGAVAGPGRDRAEVAEDVGALLPRSSLLSGWEQDDFRRSSCDGVSYALVRIEKKRVSDFIRSDAAFKQSVAALFEKRLADVEGAVRALARRLEAGMIQVAALPAIKAPQAPAALDAQAGGAMDFRDEDIDALQKYDAAVVLDKNPAARAEDKSKTWGQLAKDVPQLASLAEKRAAAWDAFAAQQRAAAEALRRRLAARDDDWGKLGKLLPLSVVTEEVKARWINEFLNAYEASPGLSADQARALAEHAPAGPVKSRLLLLAAGAPLTWVQIPGGYFIMGQQDRTRKKKDEDYEHEIPAHKVTLKGFELTKTLVTNRQYTVCEQAGACPRRECTAHWPVVGTDASPAGCVTWYGAAAFGRWAGARLPSEAEWEYAARNAGKDVRYPWGNEWLRSYSANAPNATGDVDLAPVCAQPAGNTEQGLCDMVGSMLQWTKDWYHKSYSGAPTDGSAWEAGEHSTAFIQRGHYTALTRANSYGAFGAQAERESGFRLAR